MSKHESQLIKLRTDACFVALPAHRRNKLNTQMIG
jgi:hypothetical protein